MATVTALGRTVGIAPACAALGVSRASFYRSRHPSTATPALRPTPARALSAPERHAALAVLHSERFVDVAPAELYATLLDEGRYLCSTRTYYRLLTAHQELRERRAQRPPHAYAPPTHVATAPNQVWSWDITKLLGPAKWEYLYLYVLLDIFSRYVVCWLMAPPRAV